MSTMKTLSKKTQILCVSAIMVALAAILSFLKVADMPFGGSITLCSIVPIVYVSYRYGMKWGLLSGFVFSIIQLVTGTSALKGLSGGYLAASLFLDYFIAFTVLGLGGMFRKSISNRVLGFSLGVAFAGLLRFVCHVISGFLLWATADNIAWLFGEGALATDIPWGWVQFLYSLVYNGSYMIPDILVATIAAIAFSACAKPLFFVESTEKHSKKAPQTVDA